MMPGLVGSQMEKNQKNGYIICLIHIYTPSATMMDYNYS